ncbi:hypothetical protein MIZ03_2095 [Rhodoferax lithotrophicus]|uniref:Reverse transcriptase N-terminal domain-containing protein n=1 Tax=Rhodoferax lithotrophicus TaxID=2798804 RepID=A0ABM7MLN2_9BURK|nr:hypothetical protein [Rhodoferax sp. MIZ03]BCO27207.1 hypothetical protein MIZ03_2095 [Rhodoferax sp. MIZ03]
MQSTRLLDQLRQRIRYMHLSLSTEKVDLYWVRLRLSVDTSLRRGAGGKRRVDRGLKNYSINSCLRNVDKGYKPKMHQKSAHTQACMKKRQVIQNI